MRRKRWATSDRFGIVGSGILLVGWLLSGPVWAETRDWYVVTNQVAVSDGESWATAFTNLQDVFDAVSDGDNVYLAGHVFQGAPAPDMYEVFRMANVTNIRVYGGYEAPEGLDPQDLPGPRDSDLWSTVLRRADGHARVMTLTSVSNVVFEQITFRDGRWTTDGAFNAGGLFLENCHDLVFDTCKIVNNYISTSDSTHRDGGGMLLSGSTVALYNSVVSGNTNRASSGHSGRRGAGVFVNGTSRLTVSNTVMRANRSRANANGNSFGGAVYVAGGGHLDMQKSILADNVSERPTAGANNHGRGGGLSNHGTAVLRNVLITGNRSDYNRGDGIYSEGAGAKTILINCTVADNNNGRGLEYVSGVFAVTNTIVWGHTDDLHNFPTDGDRLPDVWYSCIGDGQNDGVQGCTSVDPLFADTVHYHLQSTAGHYTNGYFSGGDWTASGFSSPLISRGDPDSDFSNEPEPNGGRINIGAYGNTSVASQMPDDMTAPEVAIVSFSSGRSRTIVRGGILDDGGDIPDTWIHYWVDGDSQTNIIYAGLQAGAFTRQLSDLTPGATYQALIVASNRKEAAESDKVTFTQRSAPADLYVSTNGNNTNGDHWNTAYDLATAILLLEEGDALHLAGHVYTGESPEPMNAGAVFEWSHLTNISLRGGYEASEGLDPQDLPGPRDSDLWPTVLRRADGHARVMTLTGVTNVVFEQITFRDGRWTTDGAFNAGGLFLENCHDLVFDTCKIVNNYISTSDSTHRDGGGMLLIGSTVALYNSVVSGNTNRASSGHSGRRGAGVFVNGTSRLTVSNTVMRANRSTSNANGNSFGGAVFVAAGGHLDMQKSILADNVSERRTADVNRPGRGGGLSNHGTALLRNVLITGNRSDYNRGDGIYSDGAGAKTILVNCTVADNNNGRGLEYVSGVFAVTNTIVWGHTDDLHNFPTDGEGHLLNVSHSLFATPDNMDNVQGCKTGNPLFVDASADDYRLQRGSPAIDAGITLPWMPGTTDLAGLPRVMMGMVDMGCYETIPPRGTLFLVR